MPDYNPMYLKLFNAITDAVKILQNAQAEAEEIYISQEEIKLTLLKPNVDNSNKNYGGDDNGEE